MKQLSPRVPGLDLLRAAAILMVLVAHYPKSGSGLFARMLNFGWTGVDLFFVLSGYLIGSQLFKSLSSVEPVNLSHFYLRRILRTLPSYFVVLAVYFFLVPEPGWRFFVFLQNFGVPPTFAPSWSLCVEEQFYLLFPIAALLLFRARMRSAQIIAVPLLLFAGIVLRGSIWLVERPDLLPEPQALATFMGTLYYPTYCRLDGIVLGVGLAALKYSHPKAWRQLMDRGNSLMLGALVMLAIAILALWKHYSLAGSTIGFTALNVSFVLFTAAALSGHGVMGRVTLPGAKMIAVLSYAIYLTHSLAIEAAQKVLGKLLLSSWVEVAFTSSLILIFAAALYWVVERPALSWRDRLISSSPAPRADREETARKFAELT